MSAEEIGRAVLSLVAAARITDLLEWFDHLNRWHHHLHPLISGEDRTKRFTNVGVLLGFEGEPSGWEVAEIKRRFKDLQELRHLEPDLERWHSNICELLDGTYNYLRTKKSKITPGQTRAMKVILELRNGCELCGLLDGHHTEKCLQFKTLRS